MTRAADPSLNRCTLSGELRRARKMRGLTQRQAAEDLEWSLSKLIRAGPRNWRDPVEVVRVMGRRADDSCGEQQR
jgi:hypothetical protein